MVARLNESYGKLLARLAVIGALLIAWVGVPYYLLQRVTLRPVWWLEPGAMDAWVPVNTSAFAVLCYWSFYLFALAPGFVPGERRFHRYVVAVFVTALISHLVFLCVPSGVLRDSVDPDHASGFYRALVSVDLPRNAFPSLHTSLSILAAVALAGGLRSRWWAVLCWAIVAVIFWSTIATRQHVFADLATGTLLACLVWTLANRRVGSRGD